MDNFSTRGLQSLFSYPFRKPDWGKKVLILAGFYLGGLIIPVIPWIFAYGYTAEVTRRAVSESDPDLPEWDHWNDLLMDGLRLFAISLVFILPLAAIYLVGFGTYFGVSLGSISLAENSRSVGPWMVALFGSLGVFMCSLMCGTLLSIVGGVLMPAATTHVIVKRSFGAFFHLRDWWRIFRANLGGYIIYIVLLYGLVFLLQMVYTIMAWTLFLLPFAFIIPFIAAPYLSLVVAILFGRVYREGQDNLTLAAEPGPAPVAESAG